MSKEKKEPLELKEGEKIFITGVNKRMEKDDYNEGADPDTAKDVFYETDGSSHESVESFFKHLEKKYSIDADDKDGFIAFEDGRMIYQTMEDADGVKASKAELEAFKKGEKELWIADYDIYIEIGSVKTPTVDEISRMFGIQTYAEGGKIRLNRFSTHGHNPLWDFLFSY